MFVLAFTVFVPFRIKPGFALCIKKVVNGLKCVNVSLIGDLIFFKIKINNM